MERAHVINWRHFLAILYILVATPVIVLALPDEGFEEISVNLSVSRIGNVEVAAIVNGTQVYLSVKDVFDFLKIQNLPSAGFDTIAGFFINPAAKFLISTTGNQVIYKGIINKLGETDLLKTEDNLFLRSDYFGRIFGLDCTFNFRNLSVLLNTRIELPAIREMQMSLMHENLNKLKQGQHADTSIERVFHPLKLGFADWSVLSRRETEGINNTQVGLALGGIVAGGETNIFLNYLSDQPMNLKQQFFRWRYVDNNNPLLRQTTAGNISTGSIASIFYPVTGVQFTNAQTSYRKSFGTYRLSDKTDPEWMVELYINNILVDYVKADASGFFTFDVPLVYGNSVVKLRFYGPWGEERTREQSIVIPFNFLPPNQFQYTATAGIVSDPQKSKFTRLAMDYGLNRYVTVGSGIEHLSSVTKRATMPFVYASARLSSNLLVTAEQVFGVRRKGILSYRLPSNIQLDVNYTKYDEEQTAVQFNYLREKKVVVSMPIITKIFTAFSRISFTQQNLLKYKYNTVEALFSSVIAGVSSNFTTYAWFTDLRNPFVYSTLSFSFRLPFGVRFTPLAQYEYGTKNWRIIRGELEKGLFARGFVNLAYEKNSGVSNSGFTLGIRYNFSFAQTAVSVRQTKKSTATYQSARGSLMYNEHEKKLFIGDQVAVSKGALIIAPFLDVNCNGKRDPDETKLAGINLRVNGGIIKVRRDSTVSITGLEAYADYLIELDKNSFENIAWQLRNKTIKVMVEPNHFQTIEVPVAVLGEVSGTVYNYSKDETSQGRMIINIYNARSELVARTISEPDGFFSYLGLVPGAYKASIDNQQLSMLKLNASQAVYFKINPNTEGDVADGLKFQVKSDKMQ